MKWITFGVEILAIVLAWTLAGWFLGKALDSVAPVVIGSISGVVHVLYSIVGKASSKQ